MVARFGSIPDSMHRRRNAGKENHGAGVRGYAGPFCFHCRNGFNTAANSSGDIAPTLR